MKGESFFIRRINPSSNINIVKKAELKKINNKNVKLSPFGSPIIYYDGYVNEDDDGANDDDKDGNDFENKFIQQILYKNRQLLNRPLLFHNRHSHYHRHFRY